MPPPDRRRVVMAGAGLFIAAPAAWAAALAAAEAQPGQAPAALACCLRYAVDPAKPDRLEAYGRGWTRAVRRCGGVPLGFFAPQEGASDVAVAVIAFASLADYERFETRMRADPSAAALARLAQKERLILSETRQVFRRA